jgi:hypothetical protein
MRRGFMTGCDSNTEWMLPWFITNYKKHNDLPLTVMDFGMTQECLKWLEGEAHSIGKMSNVPGNIKNWFLKPVSMWNSPFQETCWIDTDCEVLGDISSIFKYIMPEKLAMVEDLPWSKRSGEKWHNSGIVAFTGRPAILAEWMTAINNTPVRGDQEVLHKIMDPLRQAVYIVDLPNKYNFMRVQMVDNQNVPGALVKHWTGQKGKEHIRSLMNVE